MIDLNFSETSKDWEQSFYEGAWNPDTLTKTETENAITEELTRFLPRHMYWYDWNLPYADEIILIIRRHLKPDAITKKAVIQESTLIRLLVELGQCLHDTQPGTPEREAARAAWRYMRQEWHI